MSKKRKLTDNGRATSKGKGKGRSKVQARSEGLGKKAPYIHQHTVRKIMYWHLEERGAENMDFSDWTLAELAELVPDQSQQLLDISTSECVSAQDLANKTKQHPMMVSCGLCLFKPLFKEGRSEMLHFLCDRSNHATLLDIIQAYNVEFGIPPTPT